MAVVVKELIIKAVIDNRHDELLPQAVKSELIQETVEQVLKIVHTNEEDVR